MLPCALLSHHPSLVGGKWKSHWLGEAVTKISLCYPFRVFWSNPLNFSLQHSRLFPSLFPQFIEHMIACLNLISRGGVPSITPADISEPVYLVERKKSTHYACYSPWCCLVLSSSKVAGPFWGGGTLLSSHCFLLRFIDAVPCLHGCEGGLLPPWIQNSAL